MKSNFLLVALLSATAIAQMRNMAVDDSGAMKNIKKVAVFINLGQALPAPYQPDFDRAKKQVGEKLAKYKLQLVANASDADAVLVVTEYDVNAGATASGYTYGSGTTAVVRDRICLADDVKVFKGGKEPSPADASIWQASDSCGFSWPLNRLMDKFAKALKKAN
jgi:hypothetical protein